MKVKVKVKTKRYLLKVRVKIPTGTERAHELVCYGLDEIAQVHRAIRPEQLKKTCIDQSALNCLSVTVREDLLRRE